ncbi:hypothetical protein D3C80_2122940 [compost metagenome]
MPSMPDSTSMSIPAPLRWYWLVMTTLFAPTATVLSRFKPPVRSLLKEERWMNPSPWTRSDCIVAMAFKPTP